MNINIENIAKECHEANKKYCESIDDYSQVNWEDAPAWQKDSCIEGVKFLINNKDATNKQLHENWVKDKLSNGWCYGKTKDENKKTHPCMVSYEKLPEKQKIKDEIYGNIIKKYI